jgi:hypothetical protein
MGDDRLAAPNIHHAVTVLDPQQPAKHNGNLFEFRRLTRLDRATLTA